MAVQVSHRGTGYHAIGEKHKGPEDLKDLKKKVETGRLIGLPRKESKHENPYDTTEIAMVEPGEVSEASKFSW